MGPRLAGLQQAAPGYFQWSARHCVAKLSARCPPHAQPWPSQVGSLFIVYVLVGGLLGFSYDLIHQQFIKVRALTAPLASGVCAVR